MRALLATALLLFGCWDFDSLATLHHAPDGADTPDGGGVDADAPPDLSKKPEPVLEILAGRPGGQGTLDGQGSQARFSSPFA